MKLLSVCLTIIILCSFSLQLKSSISEENFSEIQKLQHKLMNTKQPPKGGDSSGGRFAGYEYVHKKEGHGMIKNYHKKVNYVPIRNVPVFKLLGNTYWEGWIKYFHYDYDKSSIRKPDTFYKNPFWATQKTLITKMNEFDLKGRLQNIPSLNHFWAKLLATGNLNILSNRRNEHNTLAHTVDNLNTDTIKYVHSNNNANGAIKDLGEFAEGYCLSIATLMPLNKKDKLFNSRIGDGNDQTWVFCTDDEEQKDKLMSYLVSMKMARQKKLKDILVEKKLHNESKYKYAAQLLKPKPFQPKVRRGGPSHKDGYMILLQDWSPCSKKCGGGTSTQQWLCVPPKQGGRPCPGETIVHRECNKKLCPGVFKGLGLPKNDKTHITLNPIYTALPFSTRPQNYIKCEIKENDVLYETKDFDPQHKIKVKVPAWLVMNTQTISVFRDDSYATALFNFKLKDTSFTLSKKDYCCFYLTNQNRQEKLCAFGNNCGTKQEPKWANDWGRDMEYFLQKCKVSDETQNLKNKYAKGNGRGNNNGRNPIRLDLPDITPQNIVNGKREVIQKQMQSSVQVDMDKKVDDTTKVSLTALRREVNLEDLIKKEETAKLNAKTAELRDQIKQEKKKKNLLQQALHVREQNYAQVRLAKSTQFKMDGIKHETKVDIKFQRNVLKKKIQAIRNKFKRKHRLMQQQIQLIRAEMANSIMDANKNGSMDTCKKLRNNLKGIADYCDENESTDYARNQSCKEPENFCYRCCEVEFGNMFINKRDDCETMCDNLAKKDLENGDWVWTTK